MCTAISYKTKGFYCGRTLDYEFAYPSEVVVTPRSFPLPFRAMPSLTTHHAIIGMAYVADGYPLYFDAMNEKGLVMAGLNFVESAQYGPRREDADNIAQFELLPWILGRCANTMEALGQLERLNLTNEAFSAQLPPSKLHWFLADREQSLTIEATRDGLHVYPNPVGVLTNEPPFPSQLLHLADFMALTPQCPQNRFCAKLDLQPYSRGMGALGLPGDLSSRSRFVRAAFTALNSASGSGETESVSQFFHVLDTVSQVRGCCEVGDGEYERTIYTSCCSADAGVYYYTSYENRAITAVDMHRCDLDGQTLCRYPLDREERIEWQN